MLLVTDAIVVEHVILRSLFFEVERLLPDFKNVADIQVLAKIISTLLEQHGHTEDETIYSISTLTDTERIKLTGMLKEHVELNWRLTKVIQAKNMDDACKYLRETLDYSFRHFQYEEEVVFPIVKAHVSEQELCRLGEEKYLLKPQQEYARLAQGIKATKQSNTSKTTENSASSSNGK